MDKVKDHEANNPKDQLNAEGTCLGIVHEVTGPALPDITSH